ncbi:hypothetical protein L5515_006515 [Caenorhabditis briggsae]|uniref:Uncharacterized protein n=1 Tax=Caenorhabditis briggsae TaxID=6238 RepID=A0AAE9F2J2_CAEBR|nr:hypothetical protein L5515_006515 [Caenorhabditis briggsae]
MVPGPYTRYAQYARNVAQLGFVSTSFFCFLIIILTTFFLKRKFGSYKYLLIVFPACGIVFASIEFLIYPVIPKKFTFVSPVHKLQDVYFHNAGYVFYSTSHPFYLDRDSVTCLISFYTGVYACTTSLLSVQFLYRYWAVFQ